MASWNELGSASWQLELEDAYIKNKGAVCVNKKYLDGIKSNIDNRIGLSYSELDGKTVLHIHGDIAAVILTKEVDPAMFKEVLEYEYNAPKKSVELVQPVIKQKPELKQVQEFKVAGVIFDKRQEALDRLVRYNSKDVHTYLVPEYDNEHDKNAIAVYVLVNNTNCSYRLGYIPKNETSIAKNYIGKIPELKILDGDIRGARVVFELEEPELKPVELEQPLIEQKPVEKIELKLVKTEKPKTARQARNTGNRALKMRQCDTGWTYNKLGTKQIKVCNW